MQYLRYKLVIFAITLLFWGCGSSRPVINPTPTEGIDTRPNWVKSRPTSSMYFTGIGLASMRSGELDYMEMAKKNALSDLASEIQININSNSFLYQLERETDYRDEYKAIIKSTTSENLEGFELVDSYDDDGVYWVYYRLNKADYYERKRVQKEQAIKKALDFYEKGMTQQNQENYREAISFFMKSLTSIRDYWNETNEVDFGGEKILLENEVFNSMQTLVQDLEFKTDVKTVVLNAKNSFKKRLNVKVVSKKSQRSQSGIPMVYSFPSTKKDFTGFSVSDDNGMASIMINHTDKSSSDPNLMVSMDLEAIAGMEESEIILAKALSTDINKTINVPIQTETPVIYISGEELIFGKLSEGTKIQNSVKTALSKEGYRFANSVKSADFKVKVKANSQMGNISRAFYIAFVDVEISIEDRNSGKILFLGSESNIKGVQLSYIKAHEKAYEKASDFVENEMIKDIIKSLP